MLVVVCCRVLFALLLFVVGCFVCRVLLLVGECCLLFVVDRGLSVC